MYRRMNSLENANFIQRVSEEDNRDKILEDAFLRSTEENPYLKQVRSNIALCYALKEEKHIEFLHKKRDQFRRNTSKQLRQLETQLRAAYVSKAVAAQRFEKDSLKALEKARLQDREDTVFVGRFKVGEYAEMTKKEAQLKKADLKRDLQQQMALTEAKREEEKLDRMRHKAMIDNATKKYEEEKLQEARNKSEKQRKFKEEMDEVIRVQAYYREQKKLLENAVSEDFQERIRQKKLHLEQIEQEKKKKRIRRNEISDVIGRRNYEITKEKLKSLDVLSDLLVDERKAKDDIKQNQEEERKKEQRIAIRLDMDRFQQTKKCQKLCQKKMDEAYRQKMKLHADERDRIQQLLDEKKKNKSLEHRKAQHDAFDAKEKFRAEEMHNNLLLLEYDIKERIRKDRQIERERGAMLTEHGPHLKGFLPTKNLRESDMKYLPQ